MVSCLAYAKKKYAFVSKKIGLFYFFWATGSFHSR